MKNKIFIALGILLVAGFGVLHFRVFDSGSALIVSSWHAAMGDSVMDQSSSDSGDDEVDLADPTDPADSVSLSSSPGESDPVSIAAPDPASDPVFAPAPVSSSIPTEATSSVPTISSSEPTQPSAPTQVCSFADAGVSTMSSRHIILNEIAWMGSLPEDGETSAKASEQEWIELKNISSATIDLTGWQILDANGNLKIMVGVTSTATASATIAPGGFYLLTRGNDYSGGLSNAGDKLVVLDPNCNTSDFLDASTGWPAGNNTTKQTMERDADGDGWHTSMLPGGTPAAENSVLIAAAVSSTAPIAVMITASTSSPDSASQYVVSVSSFGGGSGSVSSSPSGIICGFVCTGNFPGGTKISFSATPQAGSVFKGWSGGCVDAATQCSFVVASSVSVVAEFDPIITSSSLQIEAVSSQPSPPPSSPQISIGHLLIAAIQIAGAASSSNDFVKIYNPTGATVDMSGWKLHKKSSTGTDYSLKTFPTGATIAAGGYFVWANSAAGFADSIGADVSSTETLSADNSVALFDVNGNIVDQVAWGTGTDQYVEGSAYPTDPTPGQILGRQIANGAMVDTDNNAADFQL